MTTIPRVPDDLTGSTDEALDKIYFALAEVREDLRLAHKRVIAERDVRLIRIAAKERLALMSDPERVALLQAIRAEGVTSDEKVGEA